MLSSMSTTLFCCTVILVASKAMAAPTPTTPMPTPTTVPGGIFPLDPNSAEVQELAQKAVAKISSESNGLFQLVPVKVVDARAQIVVGWMYYLQILVGQSDCQKNDVSGAGGQQQCAEGQNKESARKIYSVKILEKPWLSPMEITYKEGADKFDDMPMTGEQKPMMATAPVLGGIFPLDPNSVEVQELAQKAVAKISSESNGLFRLVPVKVLDAKAQIVAGKLYYFQILVGQSNCLKDDFFADVVQCEEGRNKESARKVYSVKILEKLEKKSELEITYKEGGDKFE